MTSHVPVVRAAALRGRAVRGSLAAFVLGVAVLWAGQIGAQTQTERREARTFGPDIAPDPEAPNPYLSWLPADAQPDWDYWREKVRRDGIERRALLPARAPVELDELEPPGTRGLNDHPTLGEPIAGFGTLVGQSSSAVIRGRLLDPPADLGTALEPDGAIPQAATLPLLAGQRVRITGTIGDGLYGSTGTGSGDFDFFAVSGRPLERLTIAINTPEPFAGLDPLVGIYDSNGALVAADFETIEGGFLVSLDVHTSVELEADDTFYIAVGGSPSLDADQLFPADPFDPSSGPGAASQGSYELVVGLDLDLYPDLDFFAVDLRAGDVLGAVLLEGAALVELAGLDGERLVGSRRDLTGLYPATSPLPGGGGAAVAYVIERDGVYAVGVSHPEPFDPGSYEIELGVFRSPLSGEPTPSRQVVFLDFDGAVVDRSLFAPVPSQIVGLSPLGAFLSGWGLSALQEGALIDAVRAGVEENLRQDVGLLGANGDFDSTGIAGQFGIEVRTSRDHPDPSNAPSVARLVLGGTISELGISTIGIAEAIDPGNFATAGTAVVLLDLLSADAESPSSLNGVELDPGHTRLELVAQALGNIAAHEAGHLFGNFHTDRDQGPATIMDSGGRLLQVLGVGDDEVFGSGDDQDVDLGNDQYEPREVFTGTENTLEVVAFGLPVGGGRGVLGVTPSSVDFGAVDLGVLASRTVTLSNPGNQDLEIQSVELLGPDAVAFTLDASGVVGNFAAGGTRALRLDYLASTLERRSAELVITSDDPVRPTAMVPVDAQAGLPEASIDPTLHDFGTLEYGGAAISVAATFVVSNTGEGMLELAGAVIAGATPGRFVLESVGTALVPAGGSYPLAVRFRPGGPVGDARAALLAVTNDPVRPRLRVELLGRSEGPDIDVMPRPYFFGQFEVGTQRNRIFALRNRGTRALAIDPVELTTQTPAQFTVIGSPGPFVVAPFERAEVVVRFSSTVTGLAEAELRVPSVDPDEPEVIVELAGLGTVPIVEVSPLEHDFGALPFGASAQRTFLVINRGLASLWGSASLEGTTAGLALSGNLDFGLTEGGIARMTVRYSPTPDAPVAEAYLRIDTNDPATPVVLVPIFGRGTAAIPTISQLGSFLLALFLVAAAWVLLRTRS